MSSVNAASTVPAAAASAAPARAAELCEGYDATPLQSGTLVTPFFVGDATQLRHLEAAIQAKRRGSTTFGESSSTTTVGEPSSPSSMLAPEALQQQAREYEEKVLALHQLVTGGGGTEEEWTALVQQDQHALYTTLALIVAYLPLTPPAFHAALQTLYIVGTLASNDLYSVVLAHPAAMDKILASIFPELEPQELTTRFQLLDLLLVTGYVKPVPALTIDYDEVLREMMACLINAPTHVFALATTTMLLLNSFDSKRTLHSIVMEHHYTMASPNSGALSSPGAPSALSATALARFASELLVLVNAGRLPPMYVEEDATVEVHAGVNTERRASVEDLYQSARETTRAAPDRDPNCDAVTSATLAFLTELFHTNTAVDLLYSSDIEVLVEILLRQIEDRQDRLQLTLDHLLCLASIVASTAFEERPFKIAMMRDVLERIEKNFSGPAPDDLAEDDAETRLAVYELAAATRRKL